MPEGRQGLAKFFPRPGVDLSVTIGKPIDDDEIKRTLIGYKARVGREPVAPIDQTPDSLVHNSEEGWLGDAVHQNHDPSLLMREETDRTRSALTTIMQGYVQALGREVHERIR